MNYLEWLSSETDSIWWHDSANIEEQERAFSFGAVGMTTNPFLVNQTLQAYPEVWKDRVLSLAKNKKGDEKALALIKAVTGHYAELFTSMHENGRFGHGYVCAQTSPLKTGDYSYMLAQAKQYAAWYKNVVIKLPATKAGIKAYEECVALGFNVAATVSFTVPQVLKVAEAARRGKERARRAGIKEPLTIAVLMVGRLDDYLRDVAQDQESLVSESDIRQAGTACIKKAYKLFAERGYDTVLMPAGCRGAYHVTALSGAKMIMSISKGIQDELLAEKGPYETQIDKPIDQDVIDRLMTLDEFHKAYEENGMDEKAFITFGSCNRTTDQFINDGWKPLLSYEV